jgi:hypothetical protein
MNGMQAKLFEGEFENVNEECTRIKVSMDKKEDQLKV